jgi:hypothetical protein
MKNKIISVLVVLMLSISITACSSNKSSSNLNNSSSVSSNKTSGTSVPTSNPTSSPDVSANEKYLAMEAYKAVLQNKAEFFSTDNRKNIPLKDLLNRVPESPLKITHFTALDMDGDKIPEVVLELSIGNNNPIFFEVLHYMNGTVYGYNRVYRGLLQLKIDGTFNYSSGAADNGIGKLSFDSNAGETDIILGYSKSNNNNGSIPISYFINDKPVTQESFNSFLKEQAEKKDAIWYEFSQKNIETELSKN